MNINQTMLVRRSVTRLKVGELVTINDFSKISRNTVHQIFRRLSKEGLLVRVKAATYSRCEATQYGLAKSTPLMVISNEITKNDVKCFGGLFLFNQFGLTTQVPNIIEVLNNKSNYTTQIGGVSIRYTKIRPLINKKNKQQIMLLEVVKNIGKIPGGDIKKTIKWIKNAVSNLDQKSIRILANTAAEYIPRVRAVLGNIIQSDNRELSLKLQKSLKQNTDYHIGVIVKYLSDTKSWRLKE